MRRPASPVSPINQLTCLCNLVLKVLNMHKTKLGEILSSCFLYLKLKLDRSFRNMATVYSVKITRRSSDSFSPSALGFYPTRFLSVGDLSSLSQCSCPHLEFLLSVLLPSPCPSFSFSTVFLSLSSLLPLQPLLLSHPSSSLPPSAPAGPPKVT